jgi:phospholipid transport system substrate-binding protein
MLRHVVALALVIVVLVGGVSPASADTALDRIRDFFGNVNRLLADPAYDDRLPERLGAIRALVVELVDFRSAAMLALGAEWTARTPAERDEFARLFADLLHTAMFSSIGARARITNGLAVTYIGELGDRDGVTVATSVLMRTGNEMAVGYRMTQKQGRWMVYDVALDGVSLVDNYRAQFQKVIGRSSYADLVSEMRVRIAELGGPMAAAAAPSAPITVVAAVPQAIVAPRSSKEPPAVTATAAPVPADRPPVAPAVAPREWTPTITRESTVIIRDVTPSEAQAAEKPSVEPPAEARVAAATRPSTPRVARGGEYWIQVAAFRDMQKVIDTAAALRDQAVTLVTAPDQPLMRVMVGPFTDRAAAASKIRELRARGYVPFIADAAK